MNKTSFIWTRKRTNVYHRYTNYISFVSYSLSGPFKRERKVDLGLPPSTSTYTDQFCWVTLFGQFCPLYYLRSRSRTTSTTLPSRERRKDQLSDCRRSCYDSGPLSGGRGFHTTPGYLILSFTRFEYKNKTPGIHLGTFSRGLPQSHFRPLGP